MVYLDVKEKEIMPHNRRIWITFSAVEFPSPQDTQHDYSYTGCRNLKDRLPNVEDPQQLAYSETTPGNNSMSPDLLIRVVFNQKLVQDTVWARKTSEQGQAVFLGTENRARDLT
jgi:hypothetical protein